MEMNLNKTAQSYDSRETLPQERARKESYISSENCSCDIDCVCDSTQNCEITEVTSNKKLPMCRHKNRQINQIIDSQEDQNCDKDFHTHEKSTDKNTSEQCLSGENISSTQSGDNKEGKSMNTIFNKDCNNTLDELTETASSENCELSNNVDSRRTRRNSKRKRDVEDFCPVCGITVRYSELSSHYAKEVENLSKISKSIKKNRSEENRGVNTTFVQVKSNRENRHSAKVAKFSTRPRNEVSCPVCSMKLTGSQNDINNHVLNCINEEENYNEIVVVDDDEDSFEEYEFADQTRVRAISMVPGGYRSLHGDSSKPRCGDNDDEDLNVDVDDTLAYGSPQYTELDVIHNPTDDIDKEGLERLRKAVLLDPSAERHVLQSRKWDNNSDGPVNCEDSSSTLDKNKNETSEQKSENTEGLESCENTAESHVVSSLKEKIKDLEEQNKSVKCLICLEPYTKPVVSTTCWHVHCEECWLMTMGVKKLCPQCNIIVFPSDLRRIYL